MVVINLHACLKLYRSSYETRSNYVMHVYPGSMSSFQWPHHEVDLSQHHHHHHPVDYTIMHLQVLIARQNFVIAR